MGTTPTSNISRGMECDGMVLNQFQKSTGGLQHQW